MPTIRPYSSRPRWDKVELPFYGDIALGNMSQFKVAVQSAPNGYVVVSVFGHGAYVFSGEVHPNYVAEKLNLLIGDAENMADFINEQLLDDEFVERGSYCYPNLLNEAVRS